MADESPLPFPGVVHLEGRLRSVPFAADFVISKIGEDAILGMPFLEQIQCRIDFSTATVQIHGHRLDCHHHWGQQLRSTVRVALDQVAPPRSEKLLVAQINHRSCTPVGLVEGDGHAVAVAACVSKPDGHGQITVCCINPMDQPLRLPAGTKIGTYTAVDDTAVQDSDVSSRGRDEEPPS